MSRAKRTKEFRNLLEVQWTEKYWSFVLDNQDKQWCWKHISQNPNITMDIIRDNPDEPWIWNGISSNPNITIDIIKANPYQKEKELFLENAYKKYIAAYKIQQFWFKHTLSPEYVIGRKFINKKFDECFT